MQSKSTSVLSQEMHRYVFLMLGVFLLFTVSFPIAFFRVSKEKKFSKYNSHVKSLTVEGKEVNLAGESKP